MSIWFVKHYEPSSGRTVGNMKVFAAPSSTDDMETVQMQLQIAPQTVKYVFSVFLCFLHFILTVLSSCNLYEH